MRKKETSHLLFLNKQHFELLADKCRLIHNGVKYQRMIMKVWGHIEFVNISFLIFYLTLHLQFSQPQYELLSNSL